MDIKPIDSITVAMCVYNTDSDRLQAALDSVLGQSYMNFEFLIVDDGSDNPETLDILHDFQQKVVETRSDIIYVRFTHPENLGLCASRNTAIHEARGEYIYFIDSDDYMMPMALEVLANKGDAYDIIIGRCVMSFSLKKDYINEFHGTGTAQLYDFYDSMYQLCTYAESIPNQIKIHEVDFNATWNKLIRRTLFWDAIGDRKMKANTKFYPVERRKHEDNFFNFRLYNVANVALYVDAVTYLYRTGGELSGDHLFEDKSIVEARIEKQNWTFIRWDNERRGYESHKRYKKAKQNSNDDTDGFEFVDIWRGTGCEDGLSKLDWCLNNHFAYCLSAAVRYFEKTYDIEPVSDLKGVLGTNAFKLHNVDCKNLMRKVKSLRC